VSTVARSPEELEFLLEDALVLRDSDAVAALFEQGGVLVERSGRVRRVSEAARVLAAEDYQAEPASVTVVRNVAVVVGPSTVNISIRDARGDWLLVAATLTSARPA
jgi:hypothetical protein